MPSVFAIVSKKVFEKAADGLGPGEVWETSAYLSSHKGLAPVAEGGSLFLVTVRPPKEQLWLVAVLEAPKKKKDGWHAAKNTQAITDISALRSKILFESQKGMSQKKGALGMSLQTPRALATADVALLDAARGASTAKATKKSTKNAPAKKRSKKAAAEKETNTRSTAESPASGAEQTPAAAASAGPVHFTEEAKKYLSPRSADDLRPSKSSKALWRDVRAAVGSSSLNREASVPELLPVFDAIAVQAEEPMEIDLAGWAPLVVLARAYGAPKCAAYLVSRVGPEATLGVLIHAHDFGLTRDRAVVRGRGDGRPSPYMQDAVRDGLLRADGATRERALARAAEAWPSADLNMKLTILSCFPGEAAWADEAARAWLAPAQAPAHGRDTLLSGVSERELVAQIVDKAGLSGSIVDVVRRWGRDAAKLLGEMLGGKRFPNEQKAISRSLACIGTKDSAEIFAKHLRKKHVRPYATEFYSRHPELAKAALADLSKKRTQVGATARELLERLERASHKKTVKASDIAKDDDVPEILRNPPWHEETRPRKKKKKVLEGLAMPNAPMRLHWSREARRRYMTPHLGKYLFDDPDAVAAIRAKLDAGERVWVDARLPADVLLPLLEKRPSHVSFNSQVATLALARSGQDALEGVLCYFEQERVHGNTSVLLSIESPRLAACLLNQLSSEWSRQTALAWVRRYPVAAARGLVPATLSADKAARRGGETALRYLRRLGHEDVVREAAKSHGETAEALIDEIFGWDDRWDCPKKPLKMPSSFRPAELRAPRLKSGKILPGWAVVRLAEMLRFSPADYPYVGIDEVRQACEPRSLAEFAWDLAQAWDTDGGKESHEWMLRAVEHYGDDEVVRRLTPALKGEGIAKMLGRINTDAAIMELGTIIARAEQSGSVPKYAYGMHAAMLDAAAERGLEPFELEERFVPTCDVDERGGLDLDLGARRYHVGFDAGLRPVLHDDAGEAVKTLPRGGKDDDPKKVKKAHERWTDLREDVAVIARQRAAGARMAMQEGRAFPIADFRRMYVDHPLMMHLARGIVWEARDASDRALFAFRISEDGTFASSEDDPLELDESVVSVGVAHPFALSDEERSAWRQLFDDYEILQPFAQLIDDPPTLTPAELTMDELSRDLPNVQWPKVYAALLARGWKRISNGAGRVFANGVIGKLQRRDKTSTYTVQALDDELRPISLEDCSAVVRLESALALQIAAGES